MSDEDPFRYCVYCEADCYEDETQHAEDCPTNTGVFPVRRQDLAPHCPECGWNAGMLCMDCEQPLEIGDFYMHREVVAGDGESMATAPVYEVICVGCMAQEATAS